MGADTLWVRHGESTWNRAGLMQGQTAWPPLTPDGLRQARAAAAALAPHTPSRVLCSDLRRATETAHLIGAHLGLPVEPTPLLRERCWGIFEGRPVADGHRADSALSPDQALPQGESRDDVARRLRGLAPRLSTDAGPVVLVTHGDVIRVAIGLWARGDHDDHVPGNGCVVPISIGHKIRSTHA